MSITISIAGDEYRPVDVDLTIGYPAETNVVDDAAIRDVVAHATDRVLAALEIPGIT